MSATLCAQVKPQHIELMATSDTHFRTLTYSGSPLVVQAPICLVYERSRDSVRIIVQQGDVLHTMIMELEAAVELQTNMKAASLVGTLPDMQFMSATFALPTRADGTMNLDSFDTCGQPQPLVLTKGTIGVPMIWVQGVNADTSTQTVQLVCSLCAWHAWS